MASCSIEGFDFVELLGFGRSAEVWLARERVTGELVALKRLRTPADLRARARLHRELTALTELAHPHLVRLRGVVDIGDEIVLVLDHAPRGSLASLLSARGQLRPGEVGTLAVPLCQALTAMADVGLAHGDVSPSNVLFSGEGQPLLSDFGLAEILGAAPAGESGPASDVYSLALLCLAALGETPPDGVGADREESALRAVLRSATAADPCARPSAQDLAVAVYTTGAAEPISFHAVKPQRQTAPAHITHRLARRQPLATQVRRVLRPVTGAAFVALLGLVAVWLGVAWAASDAEVTRTSAGRGPTPLIRPASPAWADVLSGLDAARSSAFAQADSAQLVEVYADPSPALQRDQTLLAELVAAGRRARGLRLDIESVQLRDRGAHRVVLQVSDVLPPYELVAEDGTVATHDGRGLARWVVTLVSSESGWRIYDVVRG